MIVRLRTQQLFIDLPTPDSEPWLNIIVQRVEMDDNYTTLNVVDRWGHVSVRVAQVAMEVYPYGDPVQPPPGHISIAGIGNALTVAAMMHIIKKYGGYIDANGFIIVE